MKNDSLQPSDQRRQFRGLPHELFRSGKSTVIARRFYHIADLAYSISHIIYLSKTTPPLSDALFLPIDFGFGVSPRRNPYFAITYAFTITGDLTVMVVLTLVAFTD